MATKTISAWEARRNLGKLMDEVVARNRPMIIESHGEPKVAMMPARMAEEFIARQQAAFEQWKTIALRSTLSDDEADRLIEEAITEVRTGGGPDEPQTVAKAS